MKSIDAFSEIPAMLDQPLVDLGSLNWSVERPKEFTNLQLTGDHARYHESLMRADVRSSEYSFSPIFIDRVEYTLVGVHEIMRGTRGDETMIFFLGRGRDVVQLSISIEQAVDSVWTNVNLSNLTTRGSLPRGLGRSLYQSLFAYLQTMANRRNKTVVDTVDKFPQGKTTSQDWDRMFLPILAQQGYKPHSGHQFRKLYLPIHQ